MPCKPLELISTIVINNDLNKYVLHLYIYCIQLFCVTKWKKLFHFNLWGRWLHCPKVRRTRLIHSPLWCGRSKEETSFWREASSTRGLETRGFISTHLRCCWTHSLPRWRLPASRRPFLWVWCRGGWTCQRHPSSLLCASSCAVSASSLLSASFWPLF